MEDVFDLGPVYEEARRLIPAEATHLLLTIPSRVSASLWRLSDGMYLAEAADKTVVIGENPNKRESCLFLRHDFAKERVRKVAKDESPDAVVYEYDIERQRKIALPPGSESLVANGPVRLRKMQ